MVIDVDLLFSQHSDLSVGQEFDVVDGLIAALPYLTIFDASSLGSLGIIEASQLELAVLSGLPLANGATRVGAVDMIRTVDEPQTLVLCAFAFFALYFRLRARPSPTACADA